jgi:hypothetical protein
VNVFLARATWRKSSYSGQNGGDCVEVAALWRTSSHSGNNGGQCVEVAAAGGQAIAVRDSKDPEGPMLAFGPGEWRAFTDQVKAGVLGLG